MKVHRVRHLLPFEVRLFVADFDCCTSSLTVDLVKKNCPVETVLANPASSHTLPVSLLPEYISIIHHVSEQVSPV